MNCPVCDEVRMREVEKDDVLIDICPNCKGVWLDRGELEKITEGLREDQRYSERSDQSYNQDYRDDRDYRKDDYRKDYDSKHYPKKKRKKSMIDILSDFL
ncbi:TFIIB-type zinc ribbon-containing protein [Bacillus sp. FSL K6-3431]|uniref:TFIIB-type zinc ribbon-containing protein n=1 Tax=Bacillus sp. FSL K6-3431 TaxID=2921500 RepID=UPI0030F503DB